MITWVLTATHVLFFMAALTRSLTDASRYFYDHIASTDKQIKIYNGLYHEILNEPEKTLCLKISIPGSKAVSDCYCRSLREERRNSGDTIHNYRATFFWA